MSLRDALTRARELLAAGSIETDHEAAKLIGLLLVQKSEDYETLIDECEVTIFG